MTRAIKEIETCGCQVCKSDLAYIAPCDFTNAIDFEITLTEQEVQQIQQEID